LPNYLYDIDINLNGELLIKVLVIDTQKICDEGTDKERDEYLKQVDMKMNEFSKVNPPYFIVCGHYPVWSVGVTGSNECMVSKIRPLLHKNKVNAYFSGHDHTLEHLRDTYLNVTVDFIISGATCFVEDSTPNMNTVPKDSLKFTWKSGEDQYVGCKNCSGKKN
jgi:tartrate-resistant acid phosphatase type 5